MAAALMVMPRMRSCPSAWKRFTFLICSVVDPDSEPDPDSHVIRPAGSGSISQRYVLRLKLLPFSQKCVVLAK
jgi:hypothetical protein